MSRIRAESRTLFKRFRRVQGHQPFGNPIFSRIKIECCGQDSLSQSSACCYSWCHRCHRWYCSSGLKVFLLLLLLLVLLLFPTTSKVGFLILVALSPPAVPTTSSQIGVANLLLGVATIARWNWLRFLKELTKRNGTFFWRGFWGTYNGISESTQPSYCDNP